MKTRRFAGLTGAWFAVLSALSGLSTAAGAPELGAGRRIEAGGVPIRVDTGHLVPCVADWNADGKTDLIVGQFVGGKVRLYLGGGPGPEPSLDGFEFLKAGGKEISVPSG